MNLEELRSKLQNKEDFDIEEMLKIQKGSINSDLAEEHLLYECNNLKEVDANYEPDEGPSVVDTIEQS